MAVARVAAVFALAACLTACGSGASRGITLQVTPRDVLVDEPVTISVAGLHANEPVTLTASTTDAFGKTWRAKAEFVADVHGRVDVARAASHAGTYTGRARMGLFWSMREVGTKTPPDQEYLELPTVSHTVVRATTRGRTVGTAAITRRWHSDNVDFMRTTIASDGFVGCYWGPAHPKHPVPAVVTWGGSEGGLQCGTGLLASHGIAELNIGYFDLPGLPTYLERVPIEYFGRAVRWLAARPGVDPKRISVMGVSRGGEAALLTGVAFPQLVHGVISIVGSNVVVGGYGDPTKAIGSYPAWTLHGRPLPPGEPIAAWRINGKILLVAAFRDELFNSGNSDLHLVDALRAHHDANFKLLFYDDAGHALGSGVRYLPFGDVSSEYGVPVPLGGTLAGDARARSDSWGWILRFLRAP